MNLFIAAALVALAVIVVIFLAWVYLETQISKIERNGSDTANRNPDSRLP